jgi:hypothetical protein
MMPRTDIAQLAKLIGRELESGAGPSEGALATGPILAEAGATTEIAERCSPRRVGSAGIIA